MSDKGAYPRRPGEPVVRREVWRGRVIGGWAGLVVRDDEELLALYMPEGSPLAFTRDFFGAPHPWSGKERWRGHGVLQLQRPGERVAVWVLWHGPERDLGAWYLNLQDPFRRTAIGFDTCDHELDVVVRPDGTWELKDDELLEPWAERSRFTAEQVAEIRAEGARIVRELEAGRRWWDDTWAAWEPDPAWPAPELPAGWKTLEQAA